MKKNKKENIIVNVENVKTRSGWNGVKPYTRIHTPKVVYAKKIFAAADCVARCARTRWSDVDMPGKEDL